MEPLRQQYVDNTRAALLGAGRQLFAQREYVGVSAEEIVRTAGLTRGALYHHFDGKRGLFEAIGQVQGRGVRVRRVILRRVGSGGQCRRGGLLFGWGVVDGA